MRALALILTAAFASAGAVSPLVPAPQPRIYSRAEWGAGPSGASDPDPVKVRIIVHHTDNLVTDAEHKMDAAHGWEASKIDARAVLDSHVKVNGWADIGYHYLIDWQGRILEGRPLGLLGAHAEGNNPGSIGIALMGDLQDQHPTAAQLAALHALAGWLVDAYAIPPERIEGHHHYNATACPGVYLENDKDPNTPLRALRLSLIAERRGAADVAALARARARAAVLPAAFVWP
jgi:hypothetical protein